MITLVSFISPYRRDRDRVRERVDDRFVEVYMKIPLEVCEARDPKGLYKAARAGKIKGFTGIDDPYEEPLDAEIVMEVAKEGGDGTLAPPEKMAAAIIDSRAEGLPQRVSDETRTSANERRASAFEPLVKHPVEVETHNPPERTRPGRPARPSANDRDRDASPNRSRLHKKSPSAIRARRSTRARLLPRDPPLELVRGHHPVAHQS